MYEDYFPQFERQQDTSDSNQEDQDTELDSTEVHRRIESYLSESNESENTVEQTEQTDDARNTLDSDVLQNCRDGCGCKLDCLSRFQQEEIVQHVYTLREMDKDEKELYVMGAFNQISKDSKRSRYGDRKRVRLSYSFKGITICRTSFLTMFDIGKRTFEALVKHYHQNGPVSRVHGNKGKKPSHALSFPDVERVVRFIVSTADDEGLPQPAAPRGKDGMPLVFLPASTLQREIHARYESVCSDLDVRSVKIRSFESIWKQCCPHIQIAKPEADVCATCELIRKRISSARSEEDKLQASLEMTDHITTVRMEREVYKNCIEQAKANMQGLADNIGPEEPLSRDIDVHYTFDFAQNVCLPHHVKQMGPLYFLTLRKVQIFGIRTDGIPVQRNFLIDEHQTIGQDGRETHGPNAVISMLDFHLNKFAYGENVASFHADNCSGKRDCVIF